MGRFDDWWEENRGVQTWEENSALQLAWAVVCVISFFIVGSLPIPEELDFLAFMAIFFLWAFFCLGISTLSEGGALTGWNMTRKCRMILRNGRYCRNEFTVYQYHDMGGRTVKGGFYCEDCRPRTPEQEEQQLFEQSLSRLKSEWGEE